jgi:hypothetical protein
MKGIILKSFTMGSMLAGLPLLGVSLAGLPLERYMEFPPRTRYLDHAPFSWTAFVVCALLVLAMVAPLVLRGIGVRRLKKVKPSGGRHFPWWGWIGAFTGLITWALAWTRFTWFVNLQQHTFTPLWLSYVVVVNAFTYKRDGHCMMTDRPGYFLLLFPVSATFWWFFEYLNRFVQNWHYSGVDYNPWEYFCHSTLSFSTVLPAVLGTREWMRRFSWIEEGFRSFVPIRPSRPKSMAWAGLLISGVGLAGIGVWPDYLFPLLWVSPLLIIISLQALIGEPHVLNDMAEGDWRLGISSALAALFCGLFWEMWNYYSLAKWEYTIPFVDRYRIFEMPILGYAGYLSFGVECAVFGGILESVFGVTTENGRHEGIKCSMSDRRI